MSSEVDLDRLGIILRSAGSSAQDLIVAYGKVNRVFGYTAVAMERYRIVAAHARMDAIGPWIGAAVIFGTLVLASIAGVMSAP